MVMGDAMLEPLFGNQTVEKILLFLARYGTGYPRGLAGTFGLPLNGVQQQLRRLEEGGVVVSQLYGRVRLYEFNPMYPFLPELLALLGKVLQRLPQEEIDKYYMQRTRPPATR
jgi:DNA-binding transcriptional ArsR family regulator